MSLLMSLLTVLDLDHDNDFQSQITQGPRIIYSWRDNLGGTGKDLLLLRKIKKMGGSSVFRRKWNTEVQGTGREDCFPLPIFFHELPEKRWLKEWRVDLEITPLLCERIHSGCWGEITYRIRERQREGRSGVGETKRKTYGEGGGRRWVRSREHAMGGSNTVGNIRTAPRDEMPASLGRIEIVSAHILARRNSHFSFPFKMTSSFSLNKTFW